MRLADILTNALVCGCVRARGVLLSINVTIWYASVHDVPTGKLTFRRINTPRALGQYQS